MVKTLDQGPYGTISPLAGVDPYLAKVAIAFIFGPTNLPGGDTQIRASPGPVNSANVRNGVDRRWDGGMDQTDRNLQMGLRARSLRRASGKTLQAIADRSDMSKGHLSRFERGEKTLSLAALVRLAEALDCPVAALMGEQLTKSDVHVVRASSLESHTIVERESGYSYAVLSGSEQRGDTHNTMLLSLSGQGRRMSTAHHAGRELLFVVSGRVCLRLGEEEIALDQGDYVEFSGHIPHELQSLSRRCVVLLIIISEG